MSTPGSGRRATMAALALGVGVLDFCAEISGAWSRWMGNADPLVFMAVWLSVDMALMVLLRDWSRALGGSRSRLLERGPDTSDATLGARSVYAVGRDTWVGTVHGSDESALFFSADEAAAWLREKPHT